MYEVRESLVFTFLIFSGLSQRYHSTQDKTICTSFKSMNQKNNGEV